MRQGLLMLAFYAFYECRLPKANVKWCLSYVASFRSILLPCYSSKLLLTSYLLTSYLSTLTRYPNLL